MAAVVEYPVYFPDLLFPAKAQTWAAIWPEAWTWVSGAIHSLPVRDATRQSTPAMPFMMLGFHHTDRTSKGQPKVERCWY